MSYERIQTTLQRLATDVADAHRDVLRERHPDREYFLTELQRMQAAVQRMLDTLERAASEAK